jgi:hypothetical protein
MKLLFLSLALASSSVIAAAQPASQPASSAQAAARQAPPSIERQMLARQYIGMVVTPEQYLRLMRAGVAAGVSDSMARNLDDSEKAEVDATMTRFLTLFEPKLRKRMPNLVEASAQVYAREFSADELRQMIAFAQSPAGRHYLTRSLELSTDPAVLIQQQGLMIDAAPIMQQIRKEQCAAHTAQRIAMGDKKAKCPLSGKPETQAG